MCSYTGGQSYRGAWSESVGEETSWIPGEYSLYYYQIISLYAVIIRRESVVLASVYYVLLHAIMLCRAHISKSNHVTSFSLSTHITDTSSILSRHVHIQNMLRRTKLLHDFRRYYPRSINDCWS